MASALAGSDRSHVAGGGFCLCALLALAGTSIARGDVFHLDGGGTVEGRLLSSEDGHYAIRTVVGVVRVPQVVVVKIETAATVFDEYDRRLEAVSDAPERQMELAEWCAEQGLQAERRTHLRRALELNPNHEGARRALGYTRVGELWVESGTVVQGPEQPEPDAGPQEDDPQRLAAAIQSQWHRRVQAIRQSMLSSSQERLVQEGRKSILEIRDPLAILPLTRVLSGGDFHCRVLLVEALRAFPQDEATMNLAVMALLDSESTIRDKVLADLAQRDDPRIVAQYREALRSGNDLVLRRAAYGLGYLNAREAVPDLIEVLTARRKRWVQVPVRKALGGMSRTFRRPTEIFLGADMRVRLAHWPELGVSDYTDNITNEWQYRPVTVFRTEVLEALKSLTGQNFGFDRADWRGWYERYTQ